MLGRRSNVLDDEKVFTMLFASGEGDGFVSFAAATGAAYCMA